MENFNKLIFRGTKTIYLILSTLLGILYVQNTIYKVLLKVINEHLLLSLWLLKPKWCLDNKLVAFKQFSSNGYR